MDWKKPNTVEFRGFNGTVDYSILRENVMLAGSHVQNSKMYSISSDERIEKKLQLFFEPDLSEKEKLIRYLDFIFGDKDEYKSIFFNRWASKVGEPFEYISTRQYTGKLSYKKQYGVEKKLNTNNNEQKEYESLKDEKER